MKKIIMFAMAMVIACSSPQGRCSLLYPFRAPEGCLSGSADAHFFPA